MLGKEGVQAKMGQEGLLRFELGQGGGGGRPLRGTTMGRKHHGDTMCNQFWKPLGRANHTARLAGDHKLPSILSGPKSTQKVYFTQDY